MRNLINRLYIGLSREMIFKINSLAAFWRQDYGVWGQQSSILPWQNGALLPPKDHNPHGAKRRELSKRSVYGSKQIKLSIACFICSISIFTLYAQTGNPNVVVENATKINSNKLDFSPTFYKEGIVFVSNRKRPKSAQKITDNKDEWLGDNFMSLYYAPVSKEDFGVPQEFSVNITTRYHEGPVVFNRNGNQIFFTRNNYKNGEKQTNRKGETLLKIYTAYKNGEDWSSIQELPFNEEEYDQCHPALSSDGLTLVFASNREGGVGGMDLYKSVYQNGQWSSPINLGPTVNTKKNEVFPYFHKDGTLYFASNGHGGYGGLDIFSTTNEGGNTWRTPTNAGSPINSLDDDFGFILDRSGKSGYFSSSRRKGLGKDDIYRFHISNAPKITPVKKEQPVSTQKEIRKIIAGVVSDGVSGSRLERVKVSLINKKNGQKLSTLTDSKGEFAFRSSPLSKDHTIEISKAGYAEYREDINFELLKEEARPIKEYFFLLHPKGREPIPNTPSTSIMPQPQPVIAPKPKDKQIKKGKDILTYKEGMVEKIELGTTIVLEEILFDYGSHILQITALSTLDNLVEILKQYPHMGIELSAHTDSRGNAQYNERLSRKRAESVASYMIRRGISPYRLIPIGSGESAIRNGCIDGVPCSESQHRSNRRIEMKMIQLITSSN